jgi:hypothetical protein
MLENSNAKPVQPKQAAKKTTVKKASAGKPSTK